MIQILIHGLCILLFALIVFYGIKYFGKQGKQLSATMRLPMKYVYTCIPLGAGIMIVHGVDAVLQHLMHMLGKEEA